MDPIWNSGRINWPQVDRGSNVVQVAAAPTNPAVTLYWWRNLVPGEDAYQAFKQFCQQFRLADYGATVLAAVGEEWIPEISGHALLVWNPAFSFTTDEINLPLGE